MTATLNWNPDFYKTGYEGFEKSEQFPTAESLAAYRQLLIEKTLQQAAFIRDEFGGRKLRVIEFGSGNGRLLVTLAQQGLLDYGLGIEISESRVRFAERWTSDLGLASVRSVAADALTFSDFREGDFDLAVCITGAFGYLRAIRESAPGEALRKMHAALRPGGVALFELYQMPALRRKMLMLNGGRLRTWSPLPAEDRFAYYLDDFQYWEEINVLRHGKIFIGRDGTIDDGREEVLTYYDDKVFRTLLEKSGFKDVRSWSDFERSEYREGESAALVVTAFACKVNS